LDVIPICGDGRLDLVDVLAAAGLHREDDMSDTNRDIGERAVVLDIQGGQVDVLGDAHALPFRDEAKPYLRELVAITNECAHLAIAAQGQVLYIDQVDSPATLRVNADIGHLAPLHCTALGKVLLAFGSVPLPTELTAHTPRTITNSEALQMHLEQVKRQGYAIDDEEYDYGVRCIAAPVYNLNGEMVAAMGISGPSNRMSLEIISTMAAKVTGTPCCRAPGCVLVTAGPDQ
jgi:DNA-binding IclR family transcriptional regulator